MNSSLINFTVLLNAIFVGCIYGLIALGISMLYGVAKVINWAYGNMLMLLIYFSWALYYSNTIDPLLVVPVTIAVSIPLFFVVHKIIESQVINEDSMGQLLITLGISTILYGLIISTFGPSPKGRVTEYSLWTFNIGDVIIQLRYLILGVIGLILLTLMHLFITRTWYGKAIQATAQNKMLSRICGISLRQIYYLAVVLVALITGLVAPFILTLWGVEPSDGAYYLSLAFAVTLIAKPGSVISALAGGIGISLTEMLTTLILGGWASGMSTSIIFIILLLIRQFRQKSAG